jgi:hypothetical protein
MKKIWFDVLVNANVDQLAAFVPGKNAVKKLKDHTFDHLKQMYSKLHDF